MIQYNKLYDNPNMKEIDSLGPVKVFEHEKDLSVHSGTEAMAAYFASQMNLRKRQVLIELNNDEYIISAGAMQWTTGNVTMTSNVKGVGDLFGKIVASKATQEPAIKPKYQGQGLLMLEPTYKHILLEDVSEWGNGIVIDDGIFLACSADLKQKVVAKRNISTMALSGEGIWNLSLIGNGIAILESPVPRDELIEFNLNNDELRIDGNMAIAWSNSLEFRVEKSSKSLVGSSVSGEGFVNVYKGTGKVLMTPTI